MSYPKNTPFEAGIEKLSHDGRGLARIDGKATFIEGALEGETVKFSYTRQKKDFAEGRLLEVTIPSPLRVEPPCPHYSICGGCSLQHLSSTAQIQVKEAQLIDLLTRIGHCKPETILPPLQAQTLHYRTKARLSTKYVAQKETTLIGFREKHSPRYIADIQTCKILDERVSQILMPLRALVNQLQARDCIAQIEVAAGDKDLALIFRHLKPLENNDLSTLVAFGKHHHLKIFLQPGGPDTVHLIEPDADSEFLTYSFDAHGIEFKFHPTDFTQVNMSLNHQMLERALNLLELNSDDVVLDLFCGLGNFSLPIAKQVKKLIGIEGSEAMVKRAQMNATHNHISNTEFYAANLENPKFLEQFKAFNVNKMLIDPPRAGALTVVKEIETLNPKQIVYVSCDPATLARDAGILVNEKGYTLVSAGVMDMFPHTAHVESIALFIRN